MPCRTANQSTEYIAPPFVGGKNAVADHECSRTNMICNQTDGDILHRILSILRICYPADSVPNCLHGINVEHRFHILHYHGQTLQSHSGINIFLGQFCIISVSVIVILGEYIVPHFYEAVTFTAHPAVRPAAAILDSTVIINLGTGAAGACPMLPEVVAFSVFIPVKTGDLLPRHTDFPGPDIVCFLILTVNGRVETLRVHACHFRQKFPAPANGLMLEIISKRKISQHLEESKMAGSLTHILNITCPDTFLAGGHSTSGRNLLPCEIGLHRCHSGINDQKTVIIVWHQRKTFHF